jgi:hypothetical protein
VQQVADVGADLELVVRAIAEVGDEQLPDAGWHQPAHRVRSAVPLIEVPDHGHTLAVWRPDGEMHSRDAAERGRMRAEPLVHAEQQALAEQMQVVVADDPAEAVRVVETSAAPSPDSTSKR